MKKENKIIIVIIAILSLISIAFYLKMDSVGSDMNNLQSNNAVLKQDVNNLEKTIENLQVSLNEILVVNENDDDLGEEKEELEEDVLLTNENIEEEVLDENNKRFWKIHSKDFILAKHTDEYWVNAPGDVYKVCNQNLDCRPLIQYEGTYAEYYIEKIKFMYSRDGNYEQWEQDEVESIRKNYIPKSFKTTIGLIKWDYFMGMAESTYIVHQTENNESLIILNNEGPDVEGDPLNIEKLIQSINY